jgi:hypothetical protein
MNFPKFRLPDNPLRTGTARDMGYNLPAAVRAGIEGPPMPHPGTRAPHQDLGELADGLVGDLQGVGGKISNLLDIPLEATVGLPGPHRIIDNALNAVSAAVRGAIRTTSK